MTLTDHDSEMAAVEAELRAREPIFHRPEWGTSRADFECMTEPDFREVGASGRIYERAYVLDVLDERHREVRAESWDVTDFRCARIAADNYLATYTLAMDGRITRRATLWRRHADGWKIVYHQGTVVSA
jgi:hypothetical protein